MEGKTTAILVNKKTHVKWANYDGKRQRVHEGELGVLMEGLGE